MSIDWDIVGPFLLGTEIYRLIVLVVRARRRAAVLELVTIDHVSHAALLKLRRETGRPLGLS